MLHFFDVLFEYFSYLILKFNVLQACMEGNINGFTLIALPFIPYRLWADAKFRLTFCE